MMMILWSLLITANAAPPLTRERLKPYQCRFRDGQDVRDLLRSGRLITAAELPDLDLKGELHALTGVNLALFDVLRMFAQASGYNLLLSPNVARSTVTFRHADPLSVLEMAELLWAELKRLNLIVIDDGRYLRVLAPCR